MDAACAPAWLKMRFSSLKASLISLSRFWRAGDHRKHILQLARRDALHLTLVNGHAEMLAFGEFADAPDDGVLKTGDVAGENVVHIEARGGEDEGVVHCVLHGVGNAGEVEIVIGAAGE